MTGALLSKDIMAFVNAYKGNGESCKSRKARAAATPRTQKNATREKSQQ
jgi:hypothetical protein